MEKFIIQGGKRLNGSVRLGGAKNVSFKVMIAALLANGQSRLLNIPQISDVEITRKIITHLGGKIRSSGERTLFIETTSIKGHEIPQKFGNQSRASTMFVGPLLARFKTAILPLPGGDNIGRRPLERHVEGLKALGAKIDFDGKKMRVTTKELRGGRYRFAKNTHTGTETLVMAAVLAKGKTILENVALEPEVDDLISCLVKMGAKIHRKPDRKIVIEGVKHLKPVIHKIMPDRNEAVSYACAAVASKGDIIVENVKKEHLTAFLQKYEQAGGGFEVGDFGIRFFYKRPLIAVQVTTAPHPGFMTDWQPLWAVVATQAMGQSTIHETVHAQRFQYVPDLLKMGARIKLYSPRLSHPQDFYNFNPFNDRPEYHHAIRISGPTPLHGYDLSVHDLRAGATLVLAALIADGTTTLTGVDLIDRGYENLDGRLMDLGATIRRTQES